MPGTARDDEVVRVVDTPAMRVHHPSDAVGVVLSAVGIVVVLLLAVYAHGTTEGVAQDIHGFSSLLARILVVPVAVLEGLVTVFVPLAVLTELAFRRLGRQMLESLAAGIAGLLLSVAADAAIRAWGSDEMISGLSVWSGNVYGVVLPGYVAGIAGLLTVAGPRSRRRTVKWSWNLLWVALAVVFVTAQITLPGAVIVLLLGRMAGQGVRYLSGVRSERAYGPDLVDGVRRAGFTPTYLVRVRDVADPQGVLRRQQVTSVTDGHVTGEVDVADLRTGEHPSVAQTVRHPAEAIVATWDPAAVALTRAGDNRVYALFTSDGDRRDVVVLDGDRQVVGFLTRLWRSLRLRGLEARNAISLRAAAERAALLSYAAASAGVRTPRLLGVAESVDSMLLVQEHVDGIVSLRDVDHDLLDDDVLADAWLQLRTAHDAGLTHRALTSDVVLVGAEDGRPPHVWLTGWESGEVASPELARRLDLAQMLALLALAVGAQRAVESAARALSPEDLESVGPILQSIALPAPTREEVRSDKTILKQLRAEIVDRMPEADLEPENLTRFSVRTIITLTLTVVAVAVIITTINADEITSALADANPWWAVATFALGILTWIGAALTLVAFSPVKIPWIRTFLTQIAGSFVALAAPAGIGPAALNLRLLTRRGVTTSLALATVALVQLTQFAVTVGILLVLSLASGDGGALVSLPSTTIMIAIGGLAALAASTLLVPAVRRWIVKRVGPTLQQVWPRLSQMLSQPSRLALGVGGNVLLSMGYVLAFDAALAAFGQSLNLVDVAVIYLVGNAAGSAVPTPGGIGAIEAALILGLTTAGVSAPIATSVVVLFRVATYWARIPIGWGVMRYLQRTGDL
ncbi:YbhN family protein [Luteimicrobium sp. NPDC057192]|uniref:lysylphosphatidylglycerol synthase transmembrane domain-containing protein n=1 Tax=Luteimicrobium sp. NPDC057192 TaxID=3346042 RepID=UPI003640081A